MSLEVGNKTKKGLFWNLLGSFIRQASSIIISIILARLLSPGEFGIIGMALVFVNITEVFIDVGFTSGLIQKKDVSDLIYSSIFYVNLGFSVILSLLIVLIAPFVADFFNDPIISSVLKYLSIVPIIAAFGVVQSTILTKRMDFKSLSIRNIISTIVGGIAGLTGAYMGLGVYSLVIQQIITALSSTVLLWSSTGWRPKLEFSLSEVRSLLGYSSYVFFDQAMLQIFNKIDAIFIGKFYSTTSLGFYSRAESLKSQIDAYTAGSLRKVMFPALSALQDNHQGFEKAYHKAFNIISGVIVLLVGPIFFLTAEIIIGLLGVKWQPCIIFFQILIFSTLTSAHIGMMAQAVLAKGYSKLKFNIGLIQRLLKLVPIIFGIWFGLVEFAIAVVVATTTFFFLFAFVVHKKLNLNFIRQMKDFFIPNIIFFAFIVIFLLFKEYINPWVYAPLFFVSNLFFLRILKHDSYNIISTTVKSITLKILKN